MGFQLALWLREAMKTSSYAMNGSVPVRWVGGARGEDGFVCVAREDDRHVEVDEDEVVAGVAQLVHDADVAMEHVGFVAEVVEACGREKRVSVSSVSR